MCCILYRITRKLLLVTIICTAQFNTHIETGFTSGREGFLQHNYTSIDFNEEVFQSLRFAVIEQFISNGILYKEEKIKNNVFVTNSKITIYSYIDSFDEAMMWIILTPSGSVADTVRTSVASGKLSVTVLLYWDGSNVGLVGFLLTLKLIYSVILLFGYALSYISICSCNRYPFKSLNRFMYTSKMST